MSKTPIDRYEYQLPEELIAQNSVEPRDQSRLLVLDRQTGDVQHKQFLDIVDEFTSGDVVVLNNTKVFKARLTAQKIGGTIDFEVVLLRPREDKWQAMVYPGRRVQVGTILDFGGLQGKVVKKRNDGVTEIRMNMSHEAVLGFCDHHGSIPIPPYVEKEPETLEKYQTTYAKEVGSVAAPTAGFHFTDQVFNALEKKGVHVVYVTLHVGLGTFQPVKSETVEDHPMHSEFVQIESDVAQTLLKAKEEGRRVIAVGTTTTRALEGATITPEGFTGDVDVFITPGFEFKVIDGLVTNFHLPKTTLLVLVSTFGGYEQVMHAYKEAIEEKYRFYSFGDAMFIR